ncbi:MAG: M15 family metallopeptidase [Alphaproteobacteria bacterium]|nr:M15 family metallopeptidase [Alphaproteobacteria bacterium]
MASKFSLSARSRRNLLGVHPDLVRVVERAIQITAVDFAVTEGLRTKARQAELVKAGKSQTMNSRHLTGHAVDLAAWVGGTVSWDRPHYFKIAEAMKAAAAELGVAIVWGGDWKTFFDGPHFELDRKVYP